MLACRASQGEGRERRRKKEKRRKARDAERRVGKSEWYMNETN